MNLQRSMWTLLVAGAFVSAPLFAQAPAGQTNTGNGADNTGVNVRDRSASEPTADNQRNNVSDRDITRQIRQSLAKDSSLSSYAHNLKIVTQNGQVTLKGPVRSEEEKKAVEAKASAIAGENKVTSELDIKAK